jgi:hypothetical protein
METLPVPIAGTPRPGWCPCPPSPSRAPAFYANDYGNRRPGSFQKDGKGTIKGTVVPVPELARDPSKPLPDAADPDDQASDDAKEGA